jgi:hypothetical protein
MQIALHASLQGMRRAAERLAETAQIIAGAPSGRVARADPAPAPPNGTPALTAAQAGGGLEGALVDLLIARRAYEANAKTLESNARLQREALLTARA